MTVLGLLVLRLVVGSVMAAHGSQKLFGAWSGPGLQSWTSALASMRFRPAAILAWTSALAEFVGGMAVFFGLLFPFSALAIIAVLVVAIITVHIPKGFFAAKGGIEFPFVLAAAALALSLAGPGAWSLDWLLGIQFPEPAGWLVGAGAIIIGLSATFAMRAKPSRPPVSQKA